MQAQKNIGGPYEPDSATVLLMHFDGDLRNETDLTEDGKSFGKTSFFTSQESSRLGKQLKIDNSNISNKSHVQIPDTSALDLTGDWTIELWVKIDSVLFQQQDGICNCPPFIVKPGEAQDNYAYSNYSMFYGEYSNEFSSGYFTQNHEGMGVRSNIHYPGWKHLTFIRDTSSQKIFQYVHQSAEDNNQLPKKGDSLMLTQVTSYDYGEDGKVAPPSISDQPLFLGASPKLDTLHHILHGAIDEVRISNVVRFKNTMTSVNQNDPSLPNAITLKQNYPNPFNPSTNIRFKLPQSEQVTINVYNTIGQKVRTLANRQMTAGSHSVNLNAEGLPSGMYIYRLKARDYSESRKMLLVK